MNTRKAVERVFLVTGGLLLGFYVAATLHSKLTAQAAIAEIQAARPQPVPAAPLTVPKPSDFNLWSAQRVEDYRASLSRFSAEPMGVVSIERLGIEAPVFAGTGDLVLNSGLGWIEGTAKPGEPGNSGLAGHRDSFLRPLKDVKVGEQVALRTREALLKYRVDEIEIVSPGDVRVLQKRKADSITLVTCYPFYFVGDAPKRFIVHARLEEQATAKADAASP